MKNTEKVVKVVNGKIVVMEQEKAQQVSVMNEVINNTIIPKAIRYSQAAHAGASKKMKKGIYNFVPVQLEVVIKVENRKGKPVIIGEGRRVRGANSPNARALMAEAGEFKKIAPITHVICSLNKEGVFEEKYSEKCNAEDSVCYEANSILTVNFDSLVESIQVEFEKDKQERKEEIKKYVLAQIIDMGLEIKTDKNGIAKASLATKDSKESKDTRIANMMYWSPSNLRSQTATFTTLDPDVAFNVLDKVSGRALSRAMKGKKSLKDLVKFSARLGILSAPSIELPEIGNKEHGVMLFIGNKNREYIEGPVDYDAANQAKIDAAGVEIDNNTNDGAIVQSVEYTKACALMLGMKLTDAQALMFAMQTRTSVLFTKVFGETKTRYNINRRRDLLLESVDPSKVLVIEAGEDVKGKVMSDYEIIIIGNKDKLGMIVDLNGAKLAKNIDLETIAQGNYTNYLLDIAKATDTKLSGQAIQKVMGVEDITLIAENMLLKDIFSTVTNCLEGEVDPKNSSLASFILRYAGDEGLKNTAALNELLSTNVKVAESKIKKMSLEIESKFLRALFDDTFFLTDNRANFTLGANTYTGRLEAYSPDVELMFADRIEAIYADGSVSNKDKAIAELMTGFAVKFPSPSVDENALFTFITRRQMAERIANSALSQADKAILLDDFLNTSYGVIKIAPSNTLKHRLAGMDTDYDGLAVFFEKPLVDGLIKRYNKFDGRSTCISLKA